MTGDIRASLQVTTQLVCENAVQLEFLVEAKPQPTPELSFFIAAVQAQLELRLGRHLHDCVASYSSLLLYFDFTQLENAEICALVDEVVAEQRQRSIAASVSRDVEIPTYYHPQVAPDLEPLAKSKNLSIETCIKRHSSQTYCVYALGFAPGFAYLGFVPPSLSSPRLRIPRRCVARGSVAIADRQTAIYPSDSPGGWNIIGRTPLPLLDETLPPEQSCALQFADRVRFVPIDRQEFVYLGGKL